MPGAAAAPAGDPVVEQTARRAEPLPDVQLTHRTNDPESRPQAPQPELKPLTERRTVLVVDDDAMTLEVLVRILKRENYELLRALSGAEAIAPATLVQRREHTEKIAARQSASPADA